MTVSQSCSSRLKSVLSRMENDLNRVGYGLWNRRDLTAATRVFRLNVELHPSYANGFDSLGEALQAAGALDEAAAAYRTALELDSSLDATAHKLEVVKLMQSHR